MRLTLRHYRSDGVTSALLYRKFSNEVANATIKRLIRGADAFCFDVDSTVITEEGIDSLASFKGVGSQVADFTKKSVLFSVLAIELIKLFSDLF
jgi:hypothetical protein